VAATVALIGVVVSGFVAFTVSKRSTYLTTVTAERSKWIDKLRGNIAELLGTCGAIHMPQDRTSEKAQAKRQDADRLIALITLQLNPDDGSGIDRKLIDLLPELVKSSERNDGTYRPIEQRFVRHTQFLLKEEWEKVKVEAKGTTLAWLSGDGRKRQKRAAKYRAFCAEDVAGGGATREHQSKDAPA
jgi:hypothetical protein